MLLNHTNTLHYNVVYKLLNLILCIMYLKNIQFEKVYLKYFQSSFLYDSIEMFKF